MGRAITRLAADDPHVRIVGGFSRSDARAPMEVASMLRDADVLIDVSAPQFLAAVLDAGAEALAGRGLVVGTTGLDTELEHRLEALAERTAVLVAANFSLGINLLLELVRIAAAALPADAFDVEIVETHHRAKADAPSGTALVLGDAVAQGRQVRLEEVRQDGRSGRSSGERPVGQIGLHALRGGSVAGEHRVLFLGTHERIELAHGAADRDVFATGAIAAARWLAGRPPGRYTMADVIDTGRLRTWTTSRSAI